MKANEIGVRHLGWVLSLLGIMTSILAGGRVAKGRVVVYTNRISPGHVAVLVDNAFPGTPRVIVLIDEKGRMVARASVAPTTQINAGGASALVFPPVSTSRSHIYILDGDAQLRMIDLNTHAATVVRRLPGGAHARVAFAVSPDDRHIAVGVVSYSDCSPPGAPGSGSPGGCASANSRVYIEDLDGGHRMELFSSSFLYEWPVAWHGNAIALGVSRLPGANGPGTNPYAAYDGYIVVDASTGQTKATMCAASATQQRGATTALGPIVAAGTLCARKTNLYVDAWTGGQQQLSHWDGSTAMVLSPDGHRVVNGLGWLDTTHVVVQSVNGGTTSVRDVRNGTTYATTLHHGLYTFVGTLPPTL